MLIGKPLKDVRFKIADLVGRCWSPGQISDDLKWQVLPSSGIAETLSFKVLHYQSVADWLFFKSTIAEDNASAAFKRISARIKGNAIIANGYEEGVDIKLAMAEFSKGMDIIAKECKDIKFSFASNTGLGSAHVYIQADHTVEIADQETNTERSVYIFVLKSSVM